MQLSVAILGGGRSTRMGQDKGLVKLGGRNLVEHSLARVAGLGDETILISNRPGDYAYLGLPIFTDVHPGKGALGGLYTALHAARGEHVLVVAYDMPFLNRALLAHLIGLRAGYDVVIPRADGHSEGLHAVYSRACLPHILADLEADRLKVIGFHKAVRVRHVEEPIMRGFDPELRSFFNVNTPEALAEASAILQASSGQDGQQDQ